MMGRTELQSNVWARIPEAERSRAKNAKPRKAILLKRKRWGCLLVFYTLDIA